MKQSFTNIKMAINNNKSIAKFAFGTAIGVINLLNYKSSPTYINAAGENKSAELYNTIIPMCVAKGLLYGYTCPISPFCMLLSIPSGTIKNHFIPYSVYRIDKKTEIIIKQKD
jgi:hypothetical protein